MNSFVFAFCAVVVAAQAATIPTAETPKTDENKPAPIPARKIPERGIRQLYPAGYPVSPYVQPQKAVYPYPLPAAAPAYPLYYPSAYPSAYPSGYPSAYPNYPGQYYPLREGESEGSSWSSYLPSGFESISNYFSSFGNYPTSYYPTSWFGTSESETANASPATEAESSDTALLKSGLASPSKVQTINSVNSIKPYVPATLDNRFRYQPAQPAPVGQPQFVVAGQPQFYGHYSAFPTQQDPSKLTAANNGAISSYLFLRNQPQLPVFQQNQQKFATPASFQQGNLKDSHQQFVHYSKELQEEQSKTVEKEAAPSDSNNVVVDSAASSDVVQPDQRAEEPKKDDENSSGSTGQ